MNENDNKKNGFNNDGNQIGEQQNLEEECTEEYAPKMSKRELFEQQMDEVRTACERYRFQYHEAANGMFIRTKSMAGWYLILTEEKPILLHENYRHIRSYGNGVMEGYHEHVGLKETSAGGMVNYIFAHDKSMLHNRKRPKMVSY